MGLAIKGVAISDSDIAVSNSLGMCDLLNCCLSDFSMLMLSPSLCSRSYFKI